MSKMDPLMAAFRQLAAAQAGSRVNAHSATTAKDTKDKADHFRDQLRSVAQGAEHDSKAKPKTAREASDVEPQGFEPLDHDAEHADGVKTRSRGRGAPSHDGSSQAPIDAAPVADWRPPDVALNAVMSRLDQAKTFAKHDDVVTAPRGQVHAPVEHGDGSDVPDALMKMQSPDVGPDQRFTLSIDAADTRLSPTIKVAVRDQETHFEPVPQLTQLQKIVDRMASDLTAAPAQANAASPAEVATPDPFRSSDKPVRMLTLQLDPPDLGAVTVKMRMAGDAVEIHLRADRYETMQMLRQERGELTDLMQSAGYSFDIASIDHTRAGDAGLSNGQPQGQPDQRPSQQSMGGGSQPGQGSSERQSSDAQSGARHNRQGHDHVQQSAERIGDVPAAPNRSGGAVYL